MVCHKHLNLLTLIYLLHPMYLGANCLHHQIEGMDGAWRPKHVVISSLYQSTYCPTNSCIICKYLDNIITTHQLFGISENLGNKLFIFDFPLLVNCLQKHCPHGEQINNINQGTGFAIFPHIKYNGHTCLDPRISNWF